MWLNISGAGLNCSSLGAAKVSAARRPDAHETSRNAIKKDSK